MSVQQIEIGRLELEDGDILLVRVPPKWSGDQIVNAERAIRSAVELTGKRATVLTGTTDIDFRIVRKSRALHHHGADNNQEAKPND